MRKIPYTNFARFVKVLAKIGELFACGQDMNDSKLRSVNGGGVNGIDGWDDTYEQFFITLEWCK